MSRNWTRGSELTRYIINGVVATGVHFFVLTVGIEFIQIHSAAIANFIAAIFGILCSFFGSRYFVFKSAQGPLTKQASYFFSLYIAIAFFHALVLYAWTDLYQYDYRCGFLIATILQIVLSYFGNKFLVFKS